MSFLSPVKVIKEIPLKDGMSVADFGCGSGGWCVPLAKQRKNMDIYAVDILKESLSALKSRAEIENVHNIRTICADLEKEIDLKEDFFDLILMSNILFQIEEKDVIMQKAYRFLKNKGNLVIVDWIVEGDDVQQRINSIAKNTGFKLVKNLNAGKEHFGKLYEKNT